MITVTVYLTFLQPLFDVYYFPTSIYTYMYCRMIQKGGLAYNVNSVFSIVKGHSLNVPSGMILQRYDSGVTVIYLSHRFYGVTWISVCGNLMPAKALFLYCT